MNTFPFGLSSRDPIYPDMTVNDARRLKRPFEKPMEVFQIVYRSPDGRYPDMDIEDPSPTTRLLKQAKPVPQVRDHTLEITGLDFNTTRKDLMTRIAVAGPFGKVYSVHLECKSIQPLARIAFFTRDSAEHFKAYANYQGICVDGKPIQVTWSKILVPETIEIGGKHDSRAIVVDGPRGMSKTRLDKLMSANGIDAEEIHDWVIKSIGPNKKEAYLLFTSYAAANAALKLFSNIGTPASLRAEYARDPVEVGVQATRNSERPDDKTMRKNGSPGFQQKEPQLVVIWNDWRIPKDPTPSGSYMTSSSTEDPNWLEDEDVDVERGRKRARLTKSKTSTFYTPPGGVW